MFINFDCMMFFCGVVVSWLSDVIIEYIFVIFLMFFYFNFLEVFCLISNI